jgi:hypothetical protein
VKHPIRWIRYRLRKPLWYLRKDVLSHRWYMGAWPDPTETKGNVILKYGYLHSVILVDEMNYLSPDTASWLYNLTIDDRQIHD